MSTELLVSKNDTWRRVSDNLQVVVLETSLRDGERVVTWQGVEAKRRRGTTKIVPFLRSFIFEGSERLRAPKDTKEHATLVQFHLARSNYLYAYAQVREMYGDTASAKDLRRQAQSEDRAARELKVEFPSGSLPVPIFVMEKGGVYQHEEGFGYESWRVKEKAGWEYRIIGTPVRVVEVDIDRFGLCLQAICTSCQEEGVPYYTVGGPSQWRLETALSAGYKHFQAKHAEE